ncbi:MAG: TIM barrel protein, partial [Clostridia bacterium]
RARDLLAQVHSDRLRILLDPANLIANSSERDMFAYLAPSIAYFHGKDRKVNDAYGRIVGDGDIDWPLFLSLYHQYCEGVPFLLEYVNLENFREVMARVAVYDEKARG